MIKTNLEEKAERQREMIKKQIENYVEIKFKTARKD